MRRVLILFCLVLLTLPAFGQESTGNIYGKVVDENGDILPGVRVTLSGSLTAPVSVLSGGKGDFRFLNLHPAQDYCVTAEIAGFKTSKQEGCIVTVGTNVSITLTMEVGGLSEEVTVTAEVPVIDLKRTGVSQNVDKETMQSIPTGRDTRSLMVFAPAVTPTRPFMGESRQGYMINSRARGSTQSSYWGQASIDGMRIEPRYYDMDAWEEFHVSIGGTNIKSRSGDLTYNMVTKRGGNNFRLGGRFLVMDETLQADNLSDSLIAEGITGTDRVIHQKDYGFNFGGPIVADKAWFWMAYGVMDSDYWLIAGDPVRFLNTTYNAKVNFQLVPENRLEIWGMSNNVHWVGRGVSATDPNGMTQRHVFHWGDPFLHVKDEQMFGDNLVVQVNGFYQDGGLFYMPTNNIVGDLRGMYNQYERIWDRRPDYDRGNSQPRHAYDISINYFNDSLFGVSHEIQGGLEYETLASVGGWGGANINQRYNYQTPTIDTTGDGLPDIVSDISMLEFVRWSKTDLGRKILSGYFMDTISTGHFNVMLGFRYDTASLFINQAQVMNSVLPDTTAWREGATTRTQGAIDALLPVFNVPVPDPDFNFGFFSPRLGVVWDIRGDGKTTLKMNFGRYPYKGDLLGHTKGSSFLPLGVEANVNFWWLDDSGDGIFDYSELYWHDSASFSPYRVFNDSGAFVGDWEDGRSFWGGFDYNNPTQLTAPSTTISDAAKRADRQATEIGVQFEHELFPDFSIGANLTYKIYNGATWTLGYYPETGATDSKDNYVQAGTLPSQVGGISTGDGAGQPYYLRSADWVPTSFSIEVPRPDFNWKYTGLDITFKKRMSNNWMMNGSFTYQKTGQYYGDNGYLDATEIWAREGRGIDSMEPRWIFKVQGLYKLPYDINIGANIFARNGWIMQEFVDIVDYNSPNTRDRTARAYLGKFEDLRLDPWISVAVRAEKMLKVTDTGRLYIMLDVFNLLNSNTVVRRQNRDIGTYYPHNDSFIANPISEDPIEIFNPRKIKIGVRFQF